MAPIANLCTLDGLVSVPGTDTKLFVDVLKTSHEDLRKSSFLRPSKFCHVRISTRHVPIITCKISLGHVPITTFKISRPRANNYF